ncbi:MAG: hypothetical protein WBA17_16420, partial [Saprospiraceae bacterium]
AHRNHPLILSAGANAIAGAEKLDFHFWTGFLRPFGPARKATGLPGAHEAGTARPAVAAWAGSLPQGDLEPISQI